MTSRSEVDIAWFAGLFEGEGCITVRPDGGVSLKVAMTDKDVLERVQSLWSCTGGIKPAGGKCAKPHWKPLYIWAEHRAERAMPILRAISPYLGDRRKARSAQAIAGLEGVLGRRMYCRRGHRLVGENLRVDRIRGRPRRHCRACRRERRKAYRAQERDYYVKNKERLNARGREYWSENKEHLNSQQRERYAQSMVSG